MQTNKAYILPFIFTSMLSACGNSAVKSNPKSPAVKSGTVEPDKQAVHAYVPLKGTYVWGEGVESFTPCGKDKDYWVFPYTDEMWEQLKTEHQNLSDQPYGGVYIEINGVLGPKLHPIVGGEYAADFDGHVVVENINLIRRKSESDCKP